MSSHALALQIRTLLEHTSEALLPLTYQQVATRLALSPPGTIRRVALALEQLMEEDVAAQKPLTAALVVSRRGDLLPAAGFFDKAVELGRFPAASEEHRDCYRQEFQAAINMRSA